ncbi:flagellar motor protein MotB [Lewinellaceae bacterium SD302]|nr:flagellar motor protein MotB [Lewinellaceae bacterium SD302]
MTTLIVLLCVVLLFIIVVQISRVRELSAKLRGEEELEERATNSAGRWLMIFMVGFLVITSVSAFYYKNYMLGYGPHESASVHGKLIDQMFNWTLITTYIVFFATQILLFWYSYKYRYNKRRKAQFISHNNTVEIVWTAIPAVVMAFLVISGLDAWNEIMGDVGTDEEVLEIEATGYQFAWILRYPGADGILGRKNFRLIDATNQLGQDWTDPRNHDDFIANNLVLPVGQKIRVRITSKDVLHDFYLPQFRVKMDAVPGIPTYFIFTPEKTTEEYRQELRKYPEYNVIDPDDDEGRMRWETFEYELACAELCGVNHWSMKKSMDVVSMEEFTTWYEKESAKALYQTSIRGTDADPLKDVDDYLPFEIDAIRQEFNTSADDALATAETDDDTFVLEYVSFATGKALLTERSRYQLEEAAKWMKAHPTVNVDLTGYTDSTGDADANLNLSEARAIAVLNFLKQNGISSTRMNAVGLGADNPRETNDTEEGRAANRRTEFTILPGAITTDS